MSNDHREDIRDAADRYTADVRRLVASMATGEHYRDPDTDDEKCDPWEVMAETFLAVEVWAPLGDAYGSHRSADLDRARVTFLLTVGGPTVSVDVDTASDAVTFHHSWGMDTGRRVDDPADPGSKTYPDRRTFDLWADLDRAGNVGPWADECGPGAPWLALAADVVEGYR